MEKENGQRLRNTALLLAAGYTLAVVFDRLRSGGRPVEDDPKIPAEGETHEP